MAPEKKHTDKEEKEKERHRASGLKRVCTLEDSIFIIDGNRIGDGDGSVRGELGGERLELLQRSLKSNLLGLIQWQLYLPHLTHA